MDFMSAWAGSTGGMTSGFVVFPIIGTISPSRKIQHAGHSYEPGNHGTARKTVFRTEASADKVRFEHIHDPQTMSGLWPYPYKLIIAYEITKGELVAHPIAENLSDSAMPFSAGLHPAFKWPLPGATPKEGHFLELTEPLTPGTAIYRPCNGLIRTDGLMASPLGRLTHGYSKPAILLMTLFSSLGLRPIARLSSSWVFRAAVTKSG
jgi:galactose mutarotase-like enzyme